MLNCGITAQKLRIYQTSQIYVFFLAASGNKMRNLNISFVTSVRLSVCTEQLDPKQVDFVKLFTGNCGNNLPTLPKFC